MSREIVFWRHAEAFDALEGQSDLDRKLTVKGQRNAERVGHWLDRNLPQRCRLLASEAKRSQQTAHCLPRKAKVLPSINPDSTSESVLALLHEFAGDEPLVIVGHQPWIGEAIATLLQLNPAQPLSIKKGAVWWLQFRDREGREGFALRAVVSPDLI